MFEPIQIITFRQKTGVTCTPEAPQYAGVQGDNGRTCLDFVLPAELAATDYLYRVEMVTGGGSLVTSDLLMPSNGIVSLMLTRLFTEAGGRCTVRLIATAIDTNGNEIGEACVLVGRIYFEDRPGEGIPAIKHGISEMLYGIAADCELAEKAALTASDAAVTATEATAEAANCLSQTETCRDIAEAAAVAAQTHAMSADATLQKASRKFATAAAVSGTGLSITLSRCSDTYIADMEIVGNNALAAEPDVLSPVTILTALDTDGFLTVTGEGHEQTLDLAGLALERWDTLFLDSDGVWKVKRATKTEAYGAQTAVLTTSDTSTDIARYLIGGAVFSPPRSMDEGYCSHLPTLRSPLYIPGLLVGFGSGTHINFRLDRELFPDTSAVKAWLTEQEALGTPVTVKYRTANVTVEVLSEEWQEKLNALRTVAGKNIASVEAAVPPSSFTFSAVATYPVLNSQLLTTALPYALPAASQCRAFSKSGGLKLCAADGSVLLQKLQFIHCVCTEEANGALSVIVDYRTADGVSGCDALAVQTGATLQTTANDVTLVSIR